ncbi:MAG: MMPL family transporter [Spirochaetes bacterium]|nr:MMPL family transporter [Spirochaetota bacterium]
MNQKNIPHENGPGHRGLPDSKGFTGAFFRGLLGKKRAVLFAAAVLAAIALPGLRHLDITVNIEDFFLDNDPVLKDQREFRRLFHANDFVGVLVEADNVFSRDTLELIKRVSDRLMKEVPLAQEAVSLVQFKAPFIGPVAIPFRNGRLDAPDEAVALFKTFLNSSPSLRGVLFSADNRQAWIRLKLRPYPPESVWDEEMKPLFRVGKKAYDVVRSFKPEKARLTATGLPVYAFRKESEMMRDLMKILGIGAVVALLLTVLIFQNVQGVAGTLFSICLSAASVFGIQGRLGISMDSAFIAVPLLLTMGVSIGYSVHIARFFKVHFRRTGDRNASAVFAMEKSAKPVLFTAFTTIAALLSFVFVEIKPIQWVGLTSAMCILFVYASSMLLFPVILSLGGDREITAEAPRASDMVERTLATFSHWLVRYRIPIIILFAAATAVTAGGVLRLKVDFNAEQMMGTRLPHMKDQARIAKSEIAAAEAIDLVLTFPEGGLADPENLKRIERLEKEIGALPLVKKTCSLAWAVRSLNSLLHGQQAIPAGKDGMRDLLEASKGGDQGYLREWVTSDYSATRIFIVLTDFSSLAIERNIRKIRSLVAGIVPSATTSFFSGPTYQMAVMNQYITRGLIRSVIFSFGLITILMMIVFKSARLGIIAMIPNIFPVLVTGSVMGYFNIPMEFVTMTVAPMIMGLSVDDTIHFLSHLKDDLENGKDFESGVTRTFTVVGSAITESTLILCVSFLVLVFSQVNSIKNMGWIASLGIFSAYLADIFVTPIIVKKLGRSSLRPAAAGSPVFNPSGAGGSRVS